MMSVMVPPLGTEEGGVNTRTGFTAAPATPPEVMDVKIIPVITAAFNPAVNVGSALVESWKPPVTLARAPPRASPVSVMVIAEVPVATPPVVRTMVVLVFVALPEVAVKDVTVLEMELTDPMK